MPIGTDNWGGLPWGTYPLSEPPLIDLDYPAAGGVLILCDAAGNEITDLEVAHTFRFENSRAASVTFLLGYDQLGASDLLSLLGSEIPRLLAYRNGRLIFSGWWQPQQETLSGSGDDGISCDFRSPFARLESRYLEQNTTLAAGADAGAFVWNLIASFVNPQGSTGLILGSQQSANSSPLIAYTPGQQVASLITDMTDAGYFAFTETPLPPGSGALAAFNIWNSLGRSLSSVVRFEYGEETLSNVISVDRTIDLPVNHVVVTGSAVTPPVVVTVDETVSQGLYGVYSDYQDYSDLSDPTSLATKANELLRPDPVQQIAFEPDPGTAPQPFDDYWLGDSISFLAKQDDVLIQATARISAIEIDRDSDGLETAHRLEFGDERVRPLEIARRGRHIIIRNPKRTAGTAPRRGHHHGSRKSPKKTGI